MRDADAFAAFNAMVLVAEGDNTMPVFKPDRALRRAASRLRSSSKKKRLAASIPRFGMKLRLRLARHLRYYGTTRECHSIETSQGRGGLGTFVASDRMSRVDVLR
jgi:hypothetical protein